MTTSDFPEYSIKQTRGASDSRRALSAEQLKTLDEIIWNLADNPQQFEPMCRVTSTGQFVYKHPTSAIEVTYSIDLTKKVLFLYHFSAPLRPRQTIFISYSHQDVEWLRLLRKFLGVLEREGVISFWDDSSIKPGERWEESIRQALDAACAAVLLVSQDFLASEFITRYELPRLLSDAEREGKKIFWIPISPSTVFDSNREITVFEALTDDPNTSLEEMPEPQRKRQLVQASQRLRGALNW
jgi:TIR domain